jgi:hypothetical protein
MHTLKHPFTGGLAPLFRALFWCALCLQQTHSLARGEDFCALTVNIVPEGGKPFTSTWIELEDPSGKIVLRRQVTDPTFRICDFGFGPHTLRVGTNECLPVAVSNLQLRIGSPISLKIVPNVCGYRSMRRGCFVYFRVVDEEGNAVPGATFSPPLTTEAARADSYGRWQSLFEGSHEITFKAQGFDPATVNIRCRQDEETDELVVMKRHP